MTTKTTDPRIPVATRVRVTSDAYLGRYIGMDGVVNRDDATNIVPYRVVFSDGSPRALFDYSELEILPVAEPAPKFNIGDRVRLSPKASSWRRGEVGDREGIIMRFNTSGAVVKWMPRPIPGANNPDLVEIELVNPSAPAAATDLRAIADEKRRRAIDLRTQADALTDQANDLIFDATAIERAATIIEASK